MNRWCCAALVALLCGCSGSFGDRVHEDVHQSVPSGSAPTVHVTNVAGTIRVETWPRSSIDVAATKYGDDASALDNISIDVARSGNDVSVSTTYHGTGRNGSVRYRIRVPSAASLQIGNVAGTVDIAGAGGNVSVQTQAGTIAARLGRVDGNRSVDLHATTGTITLWIAPDSSAAVTAQSTVGAFSSELPGITQSRQNIVGVQAGGNIGSGNARIRLTTTTGSITLRSM